MYDHLNMISYGISSSKETIGYGISSSKGPSRDRRNQWEWLWNHFNELNNQERGEAMLKVRTAFERLKFHSGKIASYQRVAQLKLQGETTHIVAACAKVYSIDPASAALAVKRGSVKCCEI